MASSSVRDGILAVIDLVFGVLDRSRRRSSYQRRYGMMTILEQRLYSYISCSSGAKWQVFETVVETSLSVERTKLKIERRTILETQLHVYITFRLIKNFELNYHGISTGKRTDTQNVLGKYAKNQRLFESHYRIKECQSYFTSTLHGTDDTRSLAHSIRLLCSAC